MGDSTAIDLFLLTLEQLMSSKVESIMKEKHQLESLKEEIKHMSDFLKVTEKKRNEHSEVMDLVKQIKDVAFEAENIIDLFVVQAIKANHCGPQQQDQLSLDLKSVKIEIEILTAEVKRICDKYGIDVNGASKKLEHSFSKNEGASSSSRGSNTSKGVELEEVVGFEEEIKNLLGMLKGKGKDDQLEIISIYGAAGGGKSTLARRAYEDRLTSSNFEIRAWVSVSQDYNKTMKRNLLNCILDVATPEKHGDYEKIDDVDKLAEEMLKCLKGKKYLIVMDDIWDVDAWNDIQRSLPNEGNGSKVLFTSRVLIKLDSSIHRIDHHLGPLKESHSWELLKKKVFRKEHCSKDLDGIGRLIAEKCKGLPIAIVATAGLLSVKTPKVWEEVLERLSLIIAKNPDGCMDILELSYNHLPLHLKACFVYIAGFPEDSEIPIRELIWLWIAEGFIQQNKGDESLEDIAKDYLKSLIDRNLVMVARKRSLGEIKACNIHDLLRQLCLQKAEDDNFLMESYRHGTCPPFTATKQCRLFIGSHLIHEFPSWSYIQNLRSFLCLSLRNYTHSSSSTNLSFFVETFELLRVLSLISTECRGKIGSGHLVLLRYLAIQLPYHTPEFLFPFSYLLNLETVNVLGRSDYFYWQNIPLPRDIFQMVKLRHLYAKSAVFKYHHGCLNLDVAAGIGLEHSSRLDSLQTMHPICPCDQCQNFLVRTPHLKKLGFFGVLISNEFVLMLPDLRFLEYLETLSFIHSGIPEKATTLFPRVLKFPPTLKRLTLKYTCLEWKELSILQTLPGLEVLKLSRWACKGPIWDATELEEGFSNLKYLRLQHLEIEEWDASEDQFPKLEVLIADIWKRFQLVLLI